MAKAALLYKDLTQAASLSGSATIAGLGLDMLADPQPRHRVRFNATSANIIIDLGASKSIDVGALVGTSLVADSTVRLRASNSDATVTGSLAYDSTVLSGVTSSDYNGLVVACFSAVTARYIRWDLTQSIGPIDIGLAPCGLLWRPYRNFAFGGAEGLNDASQREINPDTLAEFGLVGPQQRVRTLNFPGLTKAEARGDIEAMDRLVRASGDILFVEDPDAVWLERARAGIWGSFRKTGADAVAVRSAVNVFGRAFQLAERL